ncbi:tannase/feruloyl esterase family alpha/beta hydrolase [Ideonella livida]|uniref:Tannase/feruloyl esterase family alpha/beta hydrolase n=1 Tax=Ideonella livida TaxID=2707176 RepID=A0A7C9PI37_9BURK|nr:tannase/feruloyl esterase family alpha/beta hydrolase [Ideonella livida]NDY92476.1 tannase/feruloyl esterase family alpha/beta hydrolase [Ideonella livida]
MRKFASPAAAPAARPWAKAGVPLALAVATLAACGGGDDDDTPPQLAAAQPANLSGDCAALATRLSGLAHTAITSAEAVAAGTLTVGGKAVPAHCLVKGKMHERVSPVDGKTYAIGFEMRLPLAWNGRFFHQANGGLDGSVLTATGATGGGPVTHALAQGFAVLSSDAGHPGSMGPFFGLDPQARLDYGYQAVGKLTPMAKSLIQTAYGKAPDRSYFGGCSNGGRHTLVAAARYPDQYDGYLAGAPGYNLPKAAVANIFGAQQYMKVSGTTSADLSAAFTTAERKMVSAQVLAKCDALDGATDGLIQDVAACQKAFNFERDVPTCSGERDGTCLSAEQKTAIGPIFSGAVTSTGAAVYSSFPFDAGLGVGNTATWEFTAPIQRDSGAVGFVFKTPPADAATFDGTAFTLNSSIDTLVTQIHATNATYTESGMGFMTPPNPTQLQAVRNRGAKIMVYHGVSDAIFSYQDTVTWYEGVQARHGGRADDFARLYPVPGMGHCSGGNATDQFDMLSALVAWVEQGHAPDQVIAQARGTGNAGGVNADVPADWAADRSRPLCPHPKVARYNGSGSLDLATSFSCR